MNFADTSQGPIESLPAGRNLYFRRGVAFLAMLAVSLAFRAPTLTDWDSWDYAAQAIRGQSSDLLLGRWWFIAIMRAAYWAGQEVLELGVLDGYYPMQAASMLLAAGAVVAGMAWTYRLTRSAAAELLFAGLALTSPLMGIYSSAVMTESATVLFLLSGFYFWERTVESSRGGWALLAGLCLGVAVDMREQALPLCAWPIVSCVVDRPVRRGRLLTTAIVGGTAALLAGVLMAWAWYPWTDMANNVTVDLGMAKWTVNLSYWENIARWTRWMFEERSKYHVSVAFNFCYLMLYCLVVSPVAMAMLGPAVFVAARGQRRLLWLFVSTLPYFLTLETNHDLPINPRFAIPVMWQLMPVVAAAIDRLVVSDRPRYAFRLRVAFAGVVLAGAGVIVAGRGYIETYCLDFYDSQGRSYAVLQTMPQKAVIIAGPATPIGQYLNRLGVKEFDIIGRGWGWPHARLAAVVAGKIHGGKSVYANLDEQDWRRTVRKSIEWEQLREVASHYETELAGYPIYQLVRMKSLSREPASQKIPESP